jgi:hypothetical protein
MRMVVALTGAMALACAAHANDGACRWTWTGETDACHKVRLGSINTPLPNEGAFTITIDETGMSSATCPDDLPTYLATDYYWFHAVACNLQNGVAIVHNDQSRRSRSTEPLSRRTRAARRCTRSRST